MTTTPDTTTSKSRHDHWNTPPAVLDPIARFWPSGIDLDPCSNPTSVVRAGCGIMEPDDGLAATPWWSRTEAVPALVYVNPPYSKPGPWVERAAKESASGLCHVIMLVPVSIATNWWADHVWPHAAAVGFMRKRVAFLDERGKPVSGNRFETALLYYGPEGHRFGRVFRDLAHVVLGGAS